MLMINYKRIVALVALSLLAACAPSEPPFRGQKIGKPYEINGKLYRPAPDSTYDKIGEASWYGPGFSGNRTASGEMFDEDDITAAHPTLPMPSLVKVTSLVTNKSVVVRVNDRGPYHSNRIIDLSKRAAEIIGLKGKGTKQVRVQFLDKETEEYIQSIKGISPKIDMEQYNEEYWKKAENDIESLKKNTIEAGSELAPASNANFSSTFSDNVVEEFAPIQSVESEDIKQVGGVSNKHLAANVNGSSVGDENKEKNVYPNEVNEISAKPPMHPKLAAVNLVTKKTDNIVKPIPKPASVGKVIILAGSFASEENARKLARSVVKLNNDENIASVDKVSLSGRELWQVNFGPFSDTEKASVVLKKVQKLGAPDARMLGASRTN